MNLSHAQAFPDAPNLTISLIWSEKSSPTASDIAQESYAYPAIRAAQSGGLHGLVHRRPILTGWKSQAGMTSLSAKFTSICRVHCFSLITEIHISFPPGKVVVTISKVFHKQTLGKRYVNTYYCGKISFGHRWHRAIVSYDVPAPSNKWQAVGVCHGNLMTLQGFGGAHAVVMITSKLKIIGFNAIVLPHSENIAYLRWPKHYDIHSIRQPQVHPCFAQAINLLS